MKRKISFMLLCSLNLFLVGCGVKLESISISGDQILFVNESTNLSLRVNPEDAPVDSIKWTSSDTSVAQVNDGKVLGIGEGEVTITADTGEGINSMITIYVYNHTEEISFEKTELKLKPNEEQTLIVSIIPKSNTYTLRSEDSSIVKVSDEGKITATGYGKTKIYAKTEDNKEAICNVSVSVIVPDFNSMTSSDAEKWGKENNVAVKTSTEYSDSIKSGKIISQNIPSGTEISESGKSIDVVYSLGHKATLGESNALSKAKSYLSHMSFSASGLKKQLEFEGFSSSEAQYGVDNCGADWNEQAAKKAKSYMEHMSFSRISLKNQLLFEGFTDSQAEYGVKSVGY